MASVIAYTLPAMQLVCHLVAPGSSGFNLTEPAATIQSSSQPEATTQSPTQSQASAIPRPQLQATSIPVGYVPCPDIGLAYKYHSAHLSWAQARNVCIQGGAQLAVIDSAEKGEYLGRHVSFDWVQAGIIRVDDKWINVNTGDVISSSPWKRARPAGSGDCVQFSAIQGLWNYKCDDLVGFVCEIPILAIGAK